VIAAADRLIGRYRLRMSGLGAEWLACSSPVDRFRRTAHAEGSGKAANAVVKPDADDRPSRMDHHGTRPTTEAIT
jgi:hypothetical protein